MAAAAVSSSALANIPLAIETIFDTPIEIPDATPGGVQFEIVVPDQGALQIKDLNVGLIIEHTWQGDLIVTLEHKDNTLSGTLLDRVGSSAWGGSSALGYDANNFGNVGMSDFMILDDDAATSINLYAGPASGFGTGVNDLVGNWQPTDLLSIHDGTTPGGTWTFTVEDAASGDTGRVVGVALYFELIPAPGAFALLGFAGLATGRRRRR